MAVLHLTHSALVANYPNGSKADTRLVAALHGKPRSVRTWIALPDPQLPNVAARINIAAELDFGETRLSFVRGRALHSCEAVDAQGAVGGLVEADDRRHYSTFSLTNPMAPMGLLLP